MLPHGLRQSVSGPPCIQAWCFGAGCCSASTGLSPVRLIERNRLPPRRVSGTEAPILELADHRCIIDQPQAIVPNGESENLTYGQT